MKTPSCLGPLFGFVGLVLAGCGTVPDLQPFAGSTAQLASSVRGAGKSAITDARSLVEAYRDDARQVRREDGPAAAEALEKSVADLGLATEQLESAWSANVKLMEAVEGYSTSLAQIASAGKGGKASATAVGDSLKSLLDVVGSAFPGGDAVLGLAAKAYGYVAEARAAASLEKALGEAQPAIDEVARVVTANLENLGKINRALTRELAAIQADATRAQFNVGHERSLLRQATAAHDELRLKVQTALKTPDPAAREKALAEIAGRSRQLEEIIATGRAKLAPVDAAMAEARARGERQARFVVAAMVATEEWALYHRRLLAGLREKQVPGAQALMAAANDVRELLNLIRSQP